MKRYDINIWQYTGGVTILLLLALVGLNSCINNKNELDDMPRTIDFQPVIYSSQSRAGGNSLNTSSNFGVYAWLGLTNVELNHEVYIDNKEVRYDGTRNVWAAVSPCYWPGTGFLDFFCYSPYAADPQPKVTVTADYRQNKLVYTDIVADASTPDYMYSKKTINQNEDTSFGGGVSIIFNHALAMVRVSMRMNMVNDGKGTTWKVKLNKFGISGVTNKGGVELYLNDNKENWIKPIPAVWNEAPGAKEDWNLLPTLEKQLIETVEPLILKEAYVIPQALEPEMMIDIEYQLKATKGGKTTTENKSVKMPLNSIRSAEGPIVRWEMNKVISYNVVINPPSDLKPLQFSPNVDEWIGQNSGVEVNPK